MERKTLTYIKKKNKEYGYKKRQIVMREATHYIKVMMSASAHLG